MRPVYAIHIAAGSIALLAGYLALYVTKGAPLHRRAGMAFFYAMLTMCVGGAILAAVNRVWLEVNAAAAWTTAYLVLTGWVTVSRPAGWTRRLDVGLMSLAFAIAALMLTFGVEAVAAGGNRNGIPAFPFFLFGVVGLLGSIGDFRVVRTGAAALKGAHRLARHLWRMSFALLIAALSFFIGQAGVFPKAIRIMPLLALPVLAVLVTLLYWLWRVRLRGSMRGIALRTSVSGARTSESPTSTRSPRYRPAGAPCG